jgi:hypothetical protein
MTLVRMKPRSGKRIGIFGDDDNQGLMNALIQLAPAEREEIVTRMVPQLVAEIRRPPPRAQAGKPIPPDLSFPFKDAAFALLTHAEGSLVTDPDSRKQLELALAHWSSVNFAQRADESSQMYGTEQILKYLRTDGVRPLPQLLVPDAKKVDLIARLVAELGDQSTKIAASERLVKIAAEVGSEGWLKRKAPAVEAANTASKLRPTKEQFQAQLEQYQEEELMRVFSSMKRVGEAPVVNHLLKFAANKKQPPKRRAAALAALEGQIDRNNSKQVDAVLNLASTAGTPDQVRDQALRRVGEMPRKLVVDKLFSLFRHDNWKIRWMAAELVLNMSKTDQLAEFMRKLSRAKGMALTEAWRYGTLIGQMKGDRKPLELVTEYARPGNPIQARVSALGYYFENGTVKDIPQVAQYGQDDTRVPECARDAEGCEWKCTIGEGKQQEVKEITTIGEYVEYCIKPALKKRSKGDKAKKSKEKE